MSNNVIPNFLPPPHDFTMEEDDEEWSENTCEGPCAYEIFCGIIFALVVYRLIGLEIKIDLKVSINQNKSCLYNQKPQCTCVR